ncbi:MAG: zinc-ribbon domain-containing protein [Ruminococcus sp.]
MNCKQCGFEVEEGKKFCPNCGSPLQEPAAPETAESIAVPEEAPEVTAETTPEVTPEAAPQAAPESVSADTAASAPDAAPAGNAIPTPDPIPGAMLNSDAGAPYGAMPGGASNPIPGAVPNGAYDPLTNPVPPINQPPKKKKKVWLIVLLICIPILIIVIIVACLFGYGVSLGKRGAEAVNTYWDAYVNCSGEDYAKMVPEAYWDYIEDTYDVTKEDAIAGMDLFLEENAESLGGDLSYEWSQTGVEFGFGDTDTLDDVREVTDQYGLEISSGIGIGVDATITGAEDSMQESFAIWSVKIDGEWYNVSAMDDFETVCQGDYAAAAKYQKEYGDMMDAYWNALLNADAAAMSAFVPDIWWDFMSDQYGYSQSEAEGYLEQYLMELVASEYDDTSDMSVKVSITDVDDYDQSDLSDLNEGLEEYGLAGDDAKDIYVDLTVTSGGSESDESSYVTVTHIGDTWYVYDAMYYYANACYYADYMGYLE